MSRRYALALFVVLCSLAPVVAVAAPAGAHTGSQSYVYLDIYDDSIAGNVQYPISDVNEVLGLSIPQDRAGAYAAIETNLQTLQAYTNDHFAIGDGTRWWEVEFTGFRVLELSAGSYAILEFEVAERLSPVPREFTVSFDGIIADKPDRDALLLIATDWASGTFRNEGDSLLRYTNDSPTQLVTLDEASWVKGMSAVIGLGVEHIRIGSDHILFVLALVLPAVLVYRRPDSWQPAPTFGASLWRVLKIVTMFTVAHSITLALGGLGIIEISPRLVEAVIALSIAAAAIHNIRPVVENKEWLLAFGFGLFHGFGFAGLLTELGLDRSNRITSLLGFNVGIELGQMVIIFAVFPALFLLRRTRAYLGMMYAGSGLLAAGALGWAIERVFDTDIGVSRVIDPVLDWPRSLWLVAVLTVVGGTLYWLDRSRSRLRPLPSVGPEPEPELATTG